MFKKRGFNNHQSNDSKETLENFDMIQFFQFTKIKQNF